MRPLRLFVRELKRRKVFRVAGAYLMAAWVVVEAADVLQPNLQLPSWTTSLVIVLAVLAFPIALILAWALELTPEGLRPTPSEPEGPGSAVAPPAEPRGEAGRAHTGPGTGRGIPGSEPEASVLIDRLRGALPPGYSVDAELGRGGMARVYRGRDEALDRPVAIKVLLPDRATAREADRFLREARLLARLVHPHIVSVHHVGEADGLLYYVMDLMAEGTLRDRLARGPVPASEVVRLGADLADALAAVHGAGAVHRDVKPDNIFLVRGRGVLGDFGVAREEEGGSDGTDGRHLEPLTEVGQRIGTPAYMAPEQLRGGPADARSDLYALGAVLYEAASGRPWPGGAGDRAPVWSAVPGALRSVLRRALARRPDERWPDAAAFRAALLEAEGSAPPRRRGALVAGAALLLAGAVGWLAWPRGDPEAVGAAESIELPTYHLALLPCETIGLDRETAGEDVARVAWYDLELGLPDLRLVPVDRAFRWRRDAGVEVTADAAAASLRAEHVARCVVQGHGSDSTELRLLLTGTPRPGGPRRMTYRVAAAEKLSLGDSLALGVLGALPNTPAVSRGALGALGGVPLPAVLEFLAGERHFLNDEREEAEDRYVAAVRAAPDFALAAWRLADVRRWGSEPPGVDLSRLLEERGEELPEVDRMLLAARLSEPGHAEFAAYEEILRRDPGAAYAALIYGDELFHRGPLYGVGIDSAATVLRRASELDPLLVPAREHLFLAQVRLGRAEDARETLEGIRAVQSVRPPEGFTRFHPEILRQAWLERFRPEAAIGRRDTLFAAGRPGARELLEETVRFPLPYYGLGDAQAFLGDRLVRLAHDDAEARRSGYLGHGVALLAGGRTAEGLAMLDSAGTTGSSRARHAAAEWRLVGAALGVPDLAASEVLGSRETLADLVADAARPPLQRARAAWALALFGANSGDPEAAARWKAEVERLAGSADPALTGTGVQLAAFVGAVETAVAGGFEEALERSAPLATRDSVADLAFPFRRAAVYGLRGSWYRALGRPDSAAGAWLWYENSDLLGAPKGDLQAAEIDRSFGTLAGLRRALALAEVGRSAEACRLARQTLRLWRDADPGWRASVARADSLRTATCPLAHRGRRTAPAAIPS